MNDRPTPETDADAVQKYYLQGPECREYVAAHFARRLERQRDEAREDAAHWKTEYEIVVARLCGNKHPRDNGIISEHEIIPKLTQERDEAREKYFALRDLSNNATELAEKYKQERDEARAALREIAAADWRTSGELRGMAKQVLEVAK